MAVDRGGWRLTCAAVIPGNVVSRPASMAVHQVERDGENKDARRNAMLSEREDVAVKLLAECMGSMLDAELGKSFCSPK
jgi:hypothetical protein